MKPRPSQPIEKCTRGETARNEHPIKPNAHSALKTAPAARVLTCALMLSFASFFAFWFWFGSFSGFLFRISSLSSHCSSFLPFSSPLCFSSDIQTDRQGVHAGIVRTQKRPHPIRLGGWDERLPSLGLGEVGRVPVRRAHSRAESRILILLRALLDDQILDGHTALMDWAIHCKPKCRRSS